MTSAALSSRLFQSTTTDASAYTFVFLEVSRCLPVMDSKTAQAGYYVSSFLNGFPLLEESCRFARLHEQSTMVSDLRQQEHS